MKPKKNRFLAIAAASLVFPSPAFAADGTWNTTTTPTGWNTAGNWVGSVIADGSGNTAYFSTLDITANTTVNLNVNRTIGNLTFGDTAIATPATWNIDTGTAGSVLTLAGTTPTITVNALGSGAYASIGAVVAGTSGFTKTGDGMLILGSGSNTISGAITLSQGTLQLNAAALTNATSVAINAGTFVVATTSANAIGTGAKISFGGGTFQYNSNPGTDYSAQFSTSANQAYKIVTGVATTLASNLASSGGSLNVQGSGNLTLSAANTFNGTTTNAMNTGNLILSNALALQNSAIDATNSVTATATRGFILSGVTTPTFGGLTGTQANSKALSTLFNSTTGGYGSVTNLTLNPGTAVSNSYWGVIADGAAGMSLTKSGAGGQTLSGNNTYTGGTAINGGVLSIGNAAALGSTGTISFGGGALQYNGITTDLSSRFSTAASQAYNVDTNGQDVTWATALTSSGGTLTKSATGGLTLSATNTYTGATTVSAGTLTLGHATNTLADTGAVTVSGGTLALGTNSDTVGALTVSGGSITSSTGVLTGSSYDLQSGTVSAILGGTGFVATKSTSSTVTLSGVNTYTGGTNINAGTLTISNAAALGSSGTISFGGGTLQYSGITTDLSSRFSTAASQAYNVDTNGQSVTWASGLTSSGGTLKKSGTGSLTLSGGTSNTFNGAIAVNGGRLTVQDGLSLKFSTGAITVASGASFDYGQNFNNGVNLTNALTISGTGDGTLGAFNLRNNGIATGGITLAADATITHDWNYGTIQTGAISGSGKNLQLTTQQAGQPGLIVSSAIQTGAGGVSVTGVNNAPSGYNFAVQLGGTNAFTGGLTIHNGIVQLNSVGALNNTAGSENAVTFGAGTTSGALSVNGKSVVIANITSNPTAGSPVVQNSSATAATLTVGNSLNQSGTFAGVIQNGIYYTTAGNNTTSTASSALSLTKAGTGTLTLSGANTYTGITTLNAGTLSVATIGNGGVAGNLGQATNVATNLVLGGGTLRYTGTTASTDRAFTLSTGTTSNIDVSTLITTLTMSGAGANTTGALTKTGAGTLLLTGANAYTGATTVSAGKLAVNGSTSASSAVGVSNGATLAGSGTVGGNTTLASGATLAPGNSPGVLTVAGTTTLNSGSIFAWEIDTSQLNPTTNRGIAYDGLNTGSLAGSGAIFKILLTGTQDFTDAFWNQNLVWTDIFKSANGSAPLSNWASVFSGGFQYAYNGQNVAPTSQGYFTATGSSLTWSAVPEPSSAWVGLLITCGLLRRRKY